MASKPIDKDYLKSTLLSFDGSVLERKYARKTDIAEQHTHSNKDTLDKFSEFSDGTLLFNGNEISSEWEDIENKPFESLDNNTLGVENGILKVINSSDSHTHDNKDYLDKIGEVNGEFTYNGNRISSDIEISTRANNALQRETDGSYYVDGTNYDSLENRLDSIEQDYVKNNQGADNVGKTFKVDESGNVVLTDYISIQVDDDLSDTSTNPVENRIVTNKLNLKGETLFYDEDNSELQLKCGEEILSSVTIVSGGNTSFLLGEPTSVSLTNLDETVEIKWTDPDDVIVAGSTLATWSGTVVVRKAGSAPVDKTDGIIIIDSRTRNQYSENGFRDTGLSNNVTYYYGIFPYSTEDAYTNTYTDSITPTAIYPIAPINVSLEAGNEQIKVTFTKPSDATGIRIVYGTTEPTSETDGTIINTTESPYAITGLTNDTTYYIVVYSYNEKGRFTPSDILSEQPYGAGLVAWTTGSDRAIINMVNAYYNGDITLDEIKSVWSVGDTREMSLSAMEAEYVNEPHYAQTVELTIIDFDHDDLVNSVNGKTKALVTVQPKNCLNNTGIMNTTNTNEGGWEECARRSWCNNTFKNAIPSIISNSIKNVIKQNYKVYNDTTITTTLDYCFLLSETEVYGAKIHSIGSEEGTQYEYYKTSSNRIKQIKGSKTWWWERSLYYQESTQWKFIGVNDKGGQDYGGALYNWGIAPAFCL